MDATSNQLGERNFSRPLSESPTARHVEHQVPPSAGQGGPEVEGRLELLGHVSTLHVRHEATQVVVPLLAQVLNEGGELDLGVGHLRSLN
jgi:hypothetical protein